MVFPKHSVSVPAIRRALTIRYQPMGADEPVEIKAYTETAKTIAVPRQYGIGLCAELGLTYVDDTSSGRRVKFPRTPVPRAYQVEPLKEIEDCLATQYDFIFRARTGWGKTIGTLIVAARLGLSTIIFVDQENLRDQWVDSLVKHFGFQPEDVGIIQGDKCVYKNKAVTIAMVQTCSQRTLPSEVYSAFGFAIVDEVHIIGAPTFSRILLQFNAAYRLGVSATPKRRDALQKLIQFNLGEVLVRVDDEHDESAVYVAEHPTIYSEYANKAPKIGRFINEVTDDAARNFAVAEAICYLYDTGRDILVLSDRIEQLKDLESLCYYLGVPGEEMGLYVGMVPSPGYEKDPTPLRRPYNLVRHEGDQEAEPGYYFTPVRLHSSSKKAKKAVLEKIKTQARVIFATYGKFSKGVDEPRLSGGVDASPRSTSEQVQGRILRKADGKLKPIWITFTDTNSYRSLWAAAARIDDYLHNNAVVSKWTLEQGKERCDARILQGDLRDRVKLLKSMQIGANHVGLATLMTKRERLLRGAAQPRKATVPTDRKASRVVSSREARSER